MSEELYERTLAYLRDRLDAPCECLPDALLRYLCRETDRAPKITATTEEMPGPELFDYAIHRYMEKQKTAGCRLPNPKSSGAFDRSLGSGRNRWRTRYGSTTERGRRRSVICSGGNTRKSTRYWASI